MSEEAQEEEREVLSSIYDGDLSFKQISPTVFQYKVTNTSGYSIITSTLLVR